MIRNTHTILKSLALLVLLALQAMLVNAQDLTQIYSSGLNPNQSVDVLINSSASGQYVWLDGANAVQTSFAMGYWDAAGWQFGTLAAPVHPWLGFRRGGSDPLVNPIYFPESGGNIVHTRFCPLETDPQGDHAIGENYLDILETKIAFSDTKLYYTIRNNATSFPISSGLTFFSYMGMLTDPNATVPDPIVFGLMYTVEVTGIIGPGLYKITGTATSDLTLIGAIETTIDEPNGVLTLSCNLSDLMSDPDFSAWFDPNYPLVSTGAITSRISLTGGNITADTTTGIDALFKPQPINFANAHAPVFSNPHVVWSENLLSLDVVYSDADLNIAQDCRFSIDGGPEHPLFPINFNGFSQPVVYAYEAVAYGSWGQIEVKVINAGQQYSYIIQNTASDDLLAPAVPALEAFPSPVRDILHYKLADLSATEPLQIYNLRGQLLLEHFPQRAEGVLDLDGLPAGVYILRHGPSKRLFTKM